MFDTSMISHIYIVLRPIYICLIIDESRLFVPFAPNVAHSAPQGAHVPYGVPAAAIPPAPPPRLKPLPASPLKGGLPKMPYGVPAAAIPPAPPPRLKPLPASPLKGGLPKMPYGVPAAAMPPAPPPRLKPLPASPLKGGLP